MMLSIFSHLLMPVHTTLAVVAVRKHTSSVNSNAAAWGNLPDYMSAYTRLTFTLQAQSKLDCAKLLLYRASLHGM